ncbi:MAG: MarR family transcriptional regulator [Candidatus Bathyarchaeota archaeon]|nr:MarR family transcriptional regulator [Candidatus Bathyarchaeota archaeon]
MRRRLGFTAISIIVLAMFTITLSCEYRVENLDFIVYGDGVVSVRMRLTVDEVYPVITVKLPSSSADNLIVVSGSGELLPYTLRDSNLTIETLGVTGLTVEYETVELTYKDGILWGFRVDAPVNFTVTLPLNSTIVSLSSIPIRVSTLPDGRISIVMPLGLQYVEYISALYDPASRALEAIARALKSIEEAENEGRIEGLDEARRLLSEAINLLSRRMYSEAKAKALEALEAARRATKPSTSILDTIYIIVLSYWYILLGLGIGVSALILSRRIKAYRSLEDLFEKNPWLNEDERNLLKILWEKGGAAYESDLRELLNLPKTTVWRMVRRLERSGLLRVEKVRGENRVHIRR